MILVSFFFFGGGGVKRGELRRGIEREIERGRVSLSVFIYSFSPNKQAERVFSFLF